jgi:hypothetical protein
MTLTGGNRRTRRRIFLVLLFLPQVSRGPPLETARTPEEIRVILVEPTLKTLRGSQGAKKQKSENGLCVRRYKPGCTVRFKISNTT